MNLRNIIVGLFVVIISSTVLLTSNADTNNKNNKFFVIPLLKKPPVIDGDFSEPEWADALGFDGMQWKGALEDRSGRSYIGATEDTFYFAIITELPPKGTILTKTKKDGGSVVYDDAIEVFIDPAPEAKDGIRYQLLLNSQGHKYYVATPRGKAKKTGLWKNSVIFKNSLSNGKWITEIKVPLSEIAKGRKTTSGTWAISICRDWKTPWIFSSSPGEFNGSDTRFTVREGAPAIQFKHINDPFSKKVICELTIKNTGAEKLNLDVLMNIKLDAMPEVRVEKKVKIKPLETILIPFDASSNTSICDKFDLKVQVNTKDKTLYARQYKWTAPRKNRWTNIVNKKAELDFKFTYYPSKNIIRIKNILRNYKGKLPKKLRYTVLKKGTATIISQWEVASIDGLETKHQLPELDGEYELILSAGDKENKKTFVRKRYKWENNTLGLSRKVYPPFTPIILKGNILSTVFRDHTLGTNGLPAQISIKGVDILAAPIYFELKLNGCKVPLKTNQKFIEQENDVVRSEIMLQSGGFSATAKGRWEYDGTLKYDLTINSSGGESVDELVLRIPLKNQYAPMIHAIGDGMRNTITSNLKQGEGKIWSANAIKTLALPEKFCSYIFLGSPLRGLSFFAENDKGWSWDRKTPNMSVVRKNGILFLNVNLINKPLVINKPQTITFGLLAAPVKPRLPGWRTLWIKEKYTWVGTCVNWLGGPGNCANVYPPGCDTYFWEILAKANVEKVSDKEVEGCIKRGIPYFDKIDAKERKASWIRHVKYNVGQEARRGKNMIFYYNRGVYNALDEYSTFMNEWILPNYLDRGFVPVSDEIKIIPSKSYNDFAVYWYEKSFEFRNRGVYWDNWYFKPSFNTEMTDAYYNKDGTITPASGIWELRNLAKRTFQMMNEKGMKPITFAHMTSTSILPMLSFATMQYDWEWKYSRGDVQTRFSPEYNRLVSNGELAGAIPILLHDSGSDAKDERIQRTFAGSALTHELIGGGSGKVWKTLRIPLYEQYLYNQLVKTTRYWDKQNIVEINDKDYKWILYSIPEKKAVLIICAYKDKDGEVIFSLDLKKLGLNLKCKARNFETGEDITVKKGTIKLKLKKHEIIAIELLN